METKKCGKCGKHTKNRCSNYNKCQRDCRRYDTDYIIVGAGTAGTLLAKNLSQSDRGNKNVLLLESGEFVNDDPLYTSPFSPTISRPSINLLNATDDPKGADTFTSTAATLADGTNLNTDGRIRFRVGRAVGGGSAKNLLLVVHPSPDYNEALVQHTDSGWGDLVDIYRSIETYNGTLNDGGGDCRGTNGAIQVTRGAPTPSPAPDSMEEDFKDSVKSLLNVDGVTDYNDCVNTCTFYGAQRFITSGGPPVRSFGGNAYLGPDVVDKSSGCGINKWKKIHVKTKSSVSRILFDTTKQPPRAIGVEVVIDGKVCKKYYARCEVILCGGAIHNPAILQRSGLGPKEVLDDSGVNSLINNPNIGTNLLSHYGPVVVIETNRNFSNGNSPNTGAFLDIDSNGATDGSRRRLQVLTLNGVNGSVAPAVPLMNFSPERPNVFSMLLWNLTQESSGRVYIAGSDSQMFPRIDINCYINRPNNNVFADSTVGKDFGAAQQYYLFMKNMIEEMNLTTGAESYKIVWPPQSEIDPLNLDKLTPYISSAVSMTDHATGTCRMGKCDNHNKVVDDRLRVVGVKGLRCADLSILPIIPDGNTCYGAYAVGAKCFEFLTGVSLNNTNPA